VKYWIHNNMVTVGGQKMGKSLGNVINLKDAFKKYSPLVVRFFILQSHYRSTLDFTDEALEGAAKGLEKLFNTVRNVRAEVLKMQKNDGELKIEDGSFIDLVGFKKAFLEAMDDDFNTPQAIGILFDLNREVNTILAGGKTDIKILQDVNALYNELGGMVLGIMPAHVEAQSSTGVSQNDLIQFIIELRAEARTQKLWAMSDKIRDGLAKLGIIIEDKKDGTSWRHSG